MIHIFTKDGCGYCVRVKALLERIGVEYQLTNVTKDRQMINELLDNPQVKEYAHRTFPFVFDGNKFIGGYTELSIMVENGFLNDRGVNQDF